MDFSHEHISVLGRYYCVDIAGGFEEEVDEDVKGLSLAVPIQGMFVSVLVLSRETISCAQKEHTHKKKLKLFCQFWLLGKLNGIYPFTALDKTVL